MGQAIPPVDEDPKEEGRVTRLAATVFLKTELAIYTALGALLALTAVLALFDAAATFGAAVLQGMASNVLETVDGLLLVLMLVEILHTVRVSMKSGILSGEPFLIVGLIASIRRVLVITLQSSEVMRGNGWSAEREMAFRASMIELGVLAALILTMVVSIFLLRKGRAAPDSEAGP
jgi:phosphate starvation-inducible membrane PsiE